MRRGVPVQTGREAVTSSDSTYPEAAMVSSSLAGRGHREQMHPHDGQGHGGPHERPSVREASEQPSARRMCVRHAGFLPRSSHWEDSPPSWAAGNYGRHRLRLISSGATSEP